MAFQNKDMGGFRKLDANEINAVCGGNDDDIIVVNGERPEPIDFGFDLFIGIPDGFIDEYAYDLNGADAPPEDPDLCTNHTDPDTTEESSDNSNYPEGFDKALDKEIDRAAAAIAAEIASKPDSATREYSAVIWVDSEGNVRSTTIEPGTDTRSTGIGENYNQVDFDNGGKIVAIVHSHPTHFDSSTMIQGSTGLIFNVDGNTLSGEDFDNLMEKGTQAEYGYDTANYRSYLVFGGQVSEFYASDQDTNHVGAGGQATHAVKSSDYNENTGQEEEQHDCANA